MRRRRRKKGNIEPINIMTTTDKDDLFVIRKCAGYLKSYLYAKKDISRDALEMILYILGDTMDLFAVHVGNMMTSDERSLFLSSLAISRLDTEDHVKIFHDALMQFDSNAQHEIISHIQHVLEAKIEQCKYRGMSGLEKKIILLRKLFALNDVEIELCVFTAIITFWEKMESFFVHHVNCNRLSNRKILAQILGIDRYKLNKALHGTLSKISLIDLGEREFCLEDGFLEYFMDQDSQNLKSYFYERIEPKAIPLDYHQIDADRTEHLIKLLKKSSATPTNILIYGSPGTGKTSYALGIARVVGMPLYRVVPRIRDHEEVNRAGIAACMNMTLNGEGALIIVDDADGTLNTLGSFSRMKQARDKGWLNEILETRGSKVIWIVNSIEDIEESVRRRFAYSMEFKPFNKRQRARVWETVLEANRVHGMLEPQQMEALSRSHKLSPGIINMAVRKALDISGKSRKGFHDALLQNLNAARELIHGRKPMMRESIEDNYSLDGLNIDGDLDSMINQVCSFDKYLKTSSRENIRCMNLLFYGPPGTGKSELARYLGEALQREVICRKPSDVLDPFVGMTERKICRMFEDAEREEAILVVDEVDTMLFERANAQRSWEISFTNEFLANLERFKGIFIGTTNMLANLDHASIRRFHHKIGFKYLTPDGNVAFFEKLLSPILSEKLSGDGITMLRHIPNLAPGDFRAVRDRYCFCPPEELCNNTLIIELEREAHVKDLHDCRRRIGFN